MKKTPKTYNTARGIPKEQFHVNMPIDLMNELEDLAVAENRSRSNMIVVLIQEALASRA